MRTKKSYSLKNPEEFKKQLAIWSSRHRETVYLNSNMHQQQYQSYDVLVATEAFTSIVTDSLDGFQKLNDYYYSTKDWLFGYFTYDLKNDIEKLSSSNFDGLNFPELFFFQPKKIFKIQDNQLEVAYLHFVDDEIDYDFKEITSIDSSSKNESNAIQLKQRINKKEYLEKVQNILSHIQQGDIYEANFCMEFYTESAYINPIQTYFDLNNISLPPFSTFLKNNHHYAICASPERYLKKLGNKIISQPIKGTSKRFSNDNDDLQSKLDLENNQKERSENIMIVDLVRNDLSRTAVKSSVKVEELCKPYTFKQVHHLISTITSEIDNQTNHIEIIKNTFPMGSMTGAPKISAMQIIEAQEETKRGLYSGSIGYFTPEGDFDFNVVIRTILYNQSNRYLSYSVGSAITSQCDPESEYLECLLKAQAMKKVLEK